jgi:hypothetical protein
MQALALIGISGMYKHSNSGSDNDSQSTNKWRPEPVEKDEIYECESRLSMKSVTSWLQPKSNADSNSNANNKNGKESVAGSSSISQVLFKLKQLKYLLEL